MNKHIKKKFLHEIEISEEISKLLKEKASGYSVTEMSQLKSIPKEMTPFLTTVDNKFFKAFAFKYQGRLKLIPEPDPILVYFNAAYMHFIQIEKKKTEIFDRLSEEAMTEVMIKELYDYFGTTSTFVILLFTALEALVNRCITLGFVYTKVTPKKNESYSKKQIERYLSFDEKIKIVLPEATRKDFSKQHPVKYQHIENLKEFRDWIMHTKEAEGESTYDYLYKKALTFNYNDTIDAVKDFCNYYTKPNFIEDCDCSQNW